MYIWLTERCNMLCPHCCNNATKDGKDMPLPMFKKIIGNFGGEYVALGGGEPTLHPRFWDILAYAIAYCDGVWLATNGSIKDKALTLAAMAKRGVIGCDLSLDEAHDSEMVDEKVIQAFTKEKPTLRSATNGKPNYYTNCVDDAHRDHRGIRNVFDTHGNRRAPLVAAGRAPLHYPDDMLRTDCPCPDLQFKPDGLIYWCGCPDAPVVGSYDDPELHEVYREAELRECWHNEDDEIKLVICERFGIAENSGIGC